MEIPVKRWKTIQTAGLSQPKSQTIKIDLGVVWRILSTKISNSIVERN